jgi:hypothetical protein
MRLRDVKGKGGGGAPWYRYSRMELQRRQRNGCGGGSGRGGDGRVGLPPDTPAAGENCFAVHCCTTVRGGPVKTVSAANRHSAPQNSDLRPG